jgi:hypothetical protein
MLKEGINTMKGTNLEMIETSLNNNTEGDSNAQ